MTTKTDLTENQDFIRNENHYDIRIGDLMNYSAMSSDDYNKIVNHENIFGKRYHRTECFGVFDAE